MNWDITKCEDVELIRIAEQLNRCRDVKVMQELELCNEEFKLKYIHKRKQMTASKARTRMMFIIPFTLVEIGCIFVFVSSIIKFLEEGYDIVSAISMLVSLLGFVFCGYICIRLWLPEIKMLGKFNPFSKNSDVDEGVVTFDVEIKKSEERISVIRTELSAVEKEIVHLLGKERERSLIVRSQILEKHTQATEAVFGEFTLKNDEITSIQAEEMLRIYEEEIRCLEKEKNRLEKEYNETQERIINIDLNIIGVRDKIVAYVLIGTILTIIVSCFQGMMMHILGIVWCAIMLPYMFWLIKTCKEPVVSYLVEHDKNYIRDYAFVHSITPQYTKRRELARNIASCSKELHILQKKKQDIEKTWKEMTKET